MYVVFIIIIDKEICNNNNNNNTEGDLGGKTNILGGNTINDCEKKVPINMLLIFNGFRLKAV